MSELSPLAQAMLDRGTRHPHPRDRAEVTRLYRGLGIEPHEGILDFLEKYGGLEYHVRGGGGFEFCIDDLYDPTHDVGDKVLFEIGTPQVAPLIYAIDESGTIWAGEPPEYFPVASSPEVLLESDAVKDAMADRSEEWTLVTLSMVPDDRRVPRMDAVLTRLGARKVDRASDDFGAWWVQDWFRVRIFPKGPRRRFGCHLYAAPPGAIHELIGALRPYGMIGNTASRPYPFHCR